MSKSISSEVFIELMQESFARGQDITFTPSGSSMLPMLNGNGDKVTLSPKPVHLNRYDVAFYRRPKSGQLVLHRIIGFTKDGGYILCGDNQYSYEYGIEDEHILAVMTGFTHNGKTYERNDFSYRFYIQKKKIKKRLRKLLSKIYHKLFR